MRLILSQYLRTLRERDEFDRLLPDLLVAMGYVPLAKPQTGVRQYGVDLAAVGKAADGTDELLLFVIKRGDVGRNDWDNGKPTSIRPSLNEVLDLYLTKLIPPEHAARRKKIILATTGDFKQDVDFVWTGFKESNAARAEFDFWGADMVAGLLEVHMLDEHLFVDEDRADLRKALALAGDGDYDFRHLNWLLLRQLGLNADGSLATAATDARTLRKATRRAHLAAGICASWTEDETDADSRQALWVSERALLWAWHRVQLLPAEHRKHLYPEIGALLISYTAAAKRYVEVLQPHVFVRDGLAGYGREGAEFAIVLLEHIGLHASVGMTCMVQRVSDDEGNRAMRANAEVVADSLCALLQNNPASASPRLDRHAIDICLALEFLVVVGRVEQATTWLGQLTERLDYCFITKTRFPVSTDSLEDLVDLELFPGDTERNQELMRASWCVATIAGWCAVLGLDQHYEMLSRGVSKSYKSVCPQLWHPTSDWAERWYFGDATQSGYSEAPYALPEEVDEMRQRIADFLAKPEYEWLGSSPSRDAGLGALDFIACRHFRIPLPASAWYRAYGQTASTSAESARL